MKRIAEALNVARSRLAERLAGEPKRRSPRYSKAEDEKLLPLIREIVDARLTYGYRRVCALLNSRLEVLGLASVNHKRRPLHGKIINNCFQNLVI